MEPPAITFSPIFWFSRHIHSTTPFIFRTNEIRLQKFFEKKSIKMQNHPTVSAIDIWINQEIWFLIKNPFLFVWNNGSQMLPVEKLRWMQIYTLVNEFNLEWQGGLVYGKQLNILTTIVVLEKWSSMSWSDFQTPLCCVEEIMNK